MKKIGSLDVVKEVDQHALLESFISSTRRSSFQNYVSLLQVDDSVLMKYTSRLEDSYQEFSQCQSCEGIVTCKNKEKGFILTPEVTGKVISFGYQACYYLQKKMKDESYQKNMLLFESPKQIRNASMKDIYKDDANRKEVIQYMVAFNKNYKTNKNQKGIYLHGNFGTGKSYLIAALFNELAKQDIKSGIVYYPDFLRSLKESFSTDYKEKYESVKKVPILLFDDIGAESVTAWSRDEILGSILQYRMNEELPTFFTSNLTLAELEEHLSNSSVGTDKVKSRRIIERIKQLTVDMELISKNRRK